MRGPCACPGWGWLALPIMEPHRNHSPRRASTRPPPFPTSAPCPYRTGPRYYPHSLVKIHQDGAAQSPYSVGKNDQDWATPFCFGPEKFIRTGQMFYLIITFSWKDQS